MMEIKGWPLQKYSKTFKITKWREFSRNFRISKYLYVESAESRADDDDGGSWACRCSPAVVMGVNT